MSEEKAIAEKPKTIWGNALKMVKGENTNQLIEDFTAEMTLVAEGLCEDQSKLRRETDGMMKEADRRIQSLDSRIACLESELTETQRESDRIITELRTRLAALEKQSERSEKAIRGKKEEKRNVLRDLTILIAVAAVAVIAVTLALRYL